MINIPRFWHNKLEYATLREWLTRLLACCHASSVKAPITHLGR